MDTAKDYSTEKLLQDRNETLDDIELMKFALNMGVEFYGDNRSVKTRLKTNELILEIMNKELVKRGSLPILDCIIKQLQEEE